MLDRRSKQGKHGGMSRPMTVGELTAKIKRMIEQGFSHVQVIGEVSRFSKHRSGHAYFVIKDEFATLQAVIWRSTLRQLDILPQDGGQYLFTGHLTVYEPQGRYQMIVTQLFPTGEGALAAEFERRKRLFAARGWFDRERKKPIPPLPKRIGIVTSPQAAAWQDVQKVLATRPGWIEVFLSPCLVQGDNAPEDIVRALKRVASVPGLDLILLVRGGGSLEDLWCFNDERVVEAIVECPIPIISGIGHEVDTTLADLAADLRAATPSNAAELACPDRQTLRKRLPRIANLQRLATSIVHHDRQRLRHEAARMQHAWRLYLDALHLSVERLERRLDVALREIVRKNRALLLRCERTLSQLEPRRRLRMLQRKIAPMQWRLIRLGGDMLAEKRARVYALARRLSAASVNLLPDRRRRIEAMREVLSHAASRFIATRREHLARGHALLQGLDPLRVLERGFAVAQRPDGKLVTKASQLSAGDPLDVRFHDGKARTQVKRVVHHAS